VLDSVWSCAVCSIIGAAAAAAEASPTPGSPTISRQQRRPNVVLIITDDQGHGDLGFHGNPKIRTPNLDRLARESAQLRYFYVSPVCAPTRASLMTGRYNYRTGVVDTYLGRAMMYSDEVTIAEMLGAAGYRTGIFGKWHLGDNYPLRPMDQGFQESLVLKGGGLGQPSDPPDGSSYFDPMLVANGKFTKTTGYVSDVIMRAAIEFIAAARDKPFFVYLPFNCPHAPLEVPDRYYEPYKKMNLSLADFPSSGHPLRGKFDADVTAKVYGMVTNIDDNVGKLLAKLDELKIADDTIVIFLTDNGPQQLRYVSGMLDRKGSVHEGGIRVPCFIRWPDTIEAGRQIDRIAAHIDITPTLLDACGVDRPAGGTMDGRSLMPLLRGDAADWPDRTLYFQWHRGDAPELYRAFAARSQTFKLVQPAGSDGRPLAAKPNFKLFDMAADPLETKDIARKNPDIVERMRAGYEAWFRDVSATRGYAPPRIIIGSPHEDPTTLTRQDWRGPRAGWTPKDFGHWEIAIAEKGTYDVTVHFAPAGKDSRVHCHVENVMVNEPVKAGDTKCVFPQIQLSAGPAKLEAWIARGDEKSGISFVEIHRTN